MILTGFDGQATSGIRRPSASTSGIPTECTAGTQGVKPSISARATSPIRVISRIDRTA